MDWSNCEWVESEPDRLQGTPVLKNSRMPADGIIENFDDGMNAEEIAQEFDQNLDTVTGVLRFAGRVNVKTAA